MYVGFNDVGIFDKKYSRTILEVDGEVNVCGRCFIGHGSRLCIAKHAKLTIGDGFVNTAEGTIVCTKSIFIGKNVTTSWNSLIMDTDFHPVLNTLTGMQGSICKDVVIENGSWICTRAVVLKGSKIGKRCIVGAGAVVKGYFLEPECLIEGNPAIITRHHVTKGIEDHE